MLKSLISRTAVLSLQRTSLTPELSFINGSYKSHGLEANDRISVLRTRILFRYRKEHVLIGEEDNTTLQ
jgi:hypothetical protein